VVLALKSKANLSYVACRRLCVTLGFLVLKSSKLFFTAFVSFQHEGSEK
jgi:hypothetical protein